MTGRRNWRSNVAGVTGTPTHLFIYGTLIPGEERWHFLEPFVAEGRAPTADQAHGHLFDTGLDYPAARFDATNTIADCFEGLLIPLAAELADEAMELLDEVEGEPEGLYHRVVIHTVGGTRAWSYQYGQSVDDLRRLHGGSWIRRDEEPEPRSATLSFDEGRILGALIDKQLATPQNYPLTINALVASCNQKSSREPVTAFTDDDVLGALADMKERKLARVVHPTSGHGVTKHRQVLHEFLDLQRWGDEDAQLALLAMLLLRGPQTARELRDRTERHHRAETEEVVATLELLAGQGHVEMLERQPGQRDERWRELLT